TPRQASNQIPQCGDERRGQDEYRFHRRLQCKNLSSAAQSSRFAKICSRHWLCTDAETHRGVPARLCECSRASRATLHHSFATAESCIVPASVAFFTSSSQSHVSLSGGVLPRNIDLQVCAVRGVALRLGG